MAPFDVLVVGAGHAGAAVAIKLRQNGFEGTIGLLGEEPHPPYERPPLSKDYLAGKVDAMSLTTRPYSFWSDHGISLLPGKRVTAVHPDRKVVVCGDSEQFGFHDLVWAAGGAPRQLTCDGHDLPNVHAIRTRDDVEVLRKQISHARDVVVIGGGFIGLEAAAVLKGLGLNVTILEVADRLLARVAAPPVSEYFTALHRRHGVTVLTHASVDCIQSKLDGRVTVDFNGLDAITADIVIVGIGIVPNVEPLIRAGAAGMNGVDVDEHCRTSLPNVYAIGDCAAQHNAYAGDGPTRIESIQNANDQGAIVANALTGKPAAASAPPWFWSNQYGVRMQTVGVNRGWTEVVLRGAPDTDAFSAVYLRDGCIIAIDCINATKDFVQGKRLVAERSEVCARLLADPVAPLKSFWVA